MTLHAESVGANRRQPPLTPSHYDESSLDSVESVSVAILVSRLGRLRDT